MLPALDDNEDCPSRLWAEIHKLRSEAKGPEGFDTWRDAAVDERVRRVKLQSVNEKLVGHLVILLSETWPYLHSHCTINSIKQHWQDAVNYLEDRHK